MRKLTPLGLSSGMVRLPDSPMEKRKMAINSMNKPQWETNGVCVFKIMRAFKHSEINVS